ncbi:hypothetical protein ACIBF7_03145 [Nonomuraea sp. NPDC050478]|uniref:hypothetical protein n=1 Tax=Nonomuraea sp. NPDC050478 TaxID=3364365 RepID=UPI0037B0A37E
MDARMMPPTRRGQISAARNADGESVASNNCPSNIAMLTQVINQATRRVGEHRHQDAESQLVPTCFERLKKAEDREIARLDHRR